MSVWRAVTGFEGLYEVSDDGRVRSLDRVVPRRDGGTTRRPGKELRGSPNTTNGRIEVGLTRQGRRVSRYVHRLVLEAFVGPCPPDMEARHLDDDPLNNSLANLLWGTRSENVRDRVRNGIHHWAKRTHCERGHEYTEENTYLEMLPNGRPRKRMCIACMRRRVQCSACGQEMASQSLSRHFRRKHSTEGKSNE